MSPPDRSDCVHLVEGESERFLLNRGAGFAWEHLPRGARVLYPPKPEPALPDLRAAVRRALDHPLGQEPLDRKLRPGMRVTIAFDDLSLPLPQMRGPDIRAVIMEELLERLARAGVNDVHAIAALGLHRRMTPGELKHCVGRKVYSALAPSGRLYNHDAEDRDNMVLLGTTEHGEEAWLNRRAAECDLLLYVNINLVAMDGGHKSVPVGLTSYAGLRKHHCVKAMMNSRSYMDPPNSELHHSTGRMGDIVNSQVDIFTIETALDSNAFGFPIGFLGRREDEWSLLDRLSAHGNRLGLKLLPMALREKIFHAIRSPYGVTGVHAGATGPVHEKTLELVHRQQLVPVEGQADVVVAGLPFVGPYNVNSVLNPILVHCLGMGYVFNMYRNRPLLREGGVMIFTHPLEERFHPVHHPSYIDFYHEVLSQTRDPKEIEAGWEETYARDPRYVDLYRHSYAYHGVHPFYMWYWACHGQSWAGRIIYVAPGSQRAVERIGGEAAKTLEEALDMAREHVGKPHPDVTLFHFPPIFLADMQ
jgi:hypothetical protein